MTLLVPALNKCRVTKTFGKVSSKFMRLIQTGWAHLTFVKVDQNFQNQFLKLYNYKIFKRVRRNHENKNVTLCINFEVLGESKAMVHKYKSPKLNHCLLLVRYCDCSLPWN